MTKIALVGTTGFVGSAILHELLWRDYRVTAIVHDAWDLKFKEHVNFVKANVLDPKEINGIFDEHDVVISAFNAGWTNPDIYHDFMTGSIIIQRYAKKANVKRLIVSGGAGSLYITDQLQVVDSKDFPEKWKAGALAARDYLNYLKEERELDWCFVSPALEMNLTTSGMRTGEYRIGLDTPVYDNNGRSIISVEDLAVAIVDEVENPSHHRQRFTVGY